MSVSNTNRGRVCRVHGARSIGETRVAIEANSMRVVTGNLKIQQFLLNESRFAKREATNGYHCTLRGRGVHGIDIGAVRAREPNTLIARNIG